MLDDCNNAVPDFLFIFLFVPSLDIEIIGPKIGTLLGSKLACHNLAFLNNQ